jgi:hypothetical protein
MQFALRLLIRSITESHQCLSGHNFKVGWPGLDRGFAKEAPGFREDAPTPATRSSTQKLRPDNALASQLFDRHVSEPCWSSFGAETEFGTSRLRGEWYRPNKGLVYEDAPFKGLSFEL